ncbi:MAG: radical SAM protein [Candidatus Hydromicrobium americanum]|nr:MAG: radical SAM protein [Candidatus Hydromicrobium americanum]
MEEDFLFYGPVLSRRFGYSLGIDLVYLKVCVYDCVYCQLGSTTNKTVERKKYVDIDFKDFETELKKRIKNCSYLDYITFSGSGEPTLNSDIGKLIDIIKKNSDIPVLVLTSGGTLGFDGVVDDIKRADLIKVSLDAPDNRLLGKINRPCKEVSFNRNILGLKKLLDDFSGDIWLEIMILEGINDDLDSAYMFKHIIEDLGEGIKKIHLNTAIRYSGENYLKLPDRGRLEKIKDILGSKAQIIEKVIYKKYNRELVKIEEEIIELLKRRPVSINDIASSLSLNLNEVIKIIDKLLGEGEIKYSINENMKYYFKPKELKA